jgi:hypothetical protein
VARGHHKNPATRQFILLARHQTQKHTKKSKSNVGKMKITLINVIKEELIQYYLYEGVF